MSQVRFLLGSHDPIAQLVEQKNFDFPLRGKLEAIGVSRWCDSSRILQFSKCIMVPVQCGVRRG